MRKDIKITETAYLKNITYEQYIVYLIRKRYTQNDEFAILRQKDTKPNEYAEYNTYCEQCKIQAKNLFTDEVIK